MFEYVVVFASAFLAATVLPFYSEIIVISAFLAHPEQGYLIWGLASIGNTLGAVVNWMLGHFFLHYQDKPWFPFKQNQLARAQHWFQKYGVWSLLLAWAPAIGDVLTFIAGMMKIKFRVFFILTLIGKSARYLFVLYFATLIDDVATFL